MQTHWLSLPGRIWLQQEQLLAAWLTRHCTRGADCSSCCQISRPFPTFLCPFLCLSALLLSSLCLLPLQPFVDTACFGVVAADVTCCSCLQLHMCECGSLSMCVCEWVCGCERVKLTASVISSCLRLPFLHDNFWHSASLLLDACSLSLNYVALEVAKSSWHFDTSSAKLTLRSLWSGRERGDIKHCKSACSSIWALTWHSCLVTEKILAM